MSEASQPAKVEGAPGRWARSAARAVLKLRPRLLTPKLGVLRQYAPRPLRVSRRPQRLPSPPPSISIVTPSLQQGRFLRQCVESVLGQQYPGLEYFVQDGGSTDETRQILSEFDGRLSGWESAPDRGQAHAINSAFRRTRGEIMGWLNSDDVLMPGALARVAEFFDRHPPISVLYGNRILIDQDGLEIGRWILPGHDPEVLRWLDYVPQETLFWRRSAWESIGGALDESLHFAMDWDLLLRFQSAGAHFAHLRDFLGAFRVHEGHKTGAGMHSHGVSEIDRLREKYLGRKPSQQEAMRHARSFLYRHMLEHACVMFKDWTAQY